MRLALALALAQALLASPAARADDGKVDWERRVVRCTGSGAADPKDADGNPAVARISALKAARLDALRNCPAVLRGMLLESGRAVGGALKSDASLLGRVEGLVRGFRAVGEPRDFSDGGAEMDLKVSLEGAVSDALSPPSSSAPAASVPATATGGPTSLVVDARPLRLVPALALAPRVRDEAGREVYGPSRLGEAGRKAAGAAAHASDLASARRSLSDRPLPLKAVRGEGSDIVISSAALAAPFPAFLAQAKVVILADWGSQGP